MHEADAGDDLMRAALQFSQHAPRVGRVARLAEDFTVQKDQRVGGEHEGVGNFFGDGARLAVGIELADFERREVFVRDLVGFAGQDAEFDLEQFEKFCAAR